MRGLVAALAMVLLLSACDSGPAVRVRNETGGPVVLHLPQAGRYGRPLDVRLAEGKSRVVRGDALDDHARYSIRARGCDYLFDYPAIGGLNYPWYVSDGKGREVPDYRYPFPVEIWLEPDFRLYLVEGGDRRHGGGRPDPTPAHGFPMSPVATRCG